jgi:hypothetical protein
MTIKDQINALLQAIDAQGGPAREKEVIGNLVAQASKYIDIVVKQGFTAQAGESQEELIRIDQSRTRAHNSLISQIDIVNRLCEKYGLEPVYNGPDERRIKGDWAVDMINEYFRARA